MINEQKNSRLQELVNPVTSILQGVRNLYALLREIKNLLAQQNSLLQENNELLRNLTLAETSTISSFVEPNYQAALSDYPNFDWVKIGATVISSDSDGATVVEYKGLSFNRRRSSVDDIKGAAIWFSSPRKNEQGEIHYLKLISFKERSSIRSLHNEIKEQFS